MRTEWRRAALAAGLVALTLTGCGSDLDKLNTGGKLTGKVAFNGKPVKGGNVIVVSESGKTSVQGFINGDGVYTVAEPPLGKVTLTVQTSHLRGSVVPKGDPSAGKGKGGEGSRGMVMPDAKEIGLEFTAIPEKYEKPGTSGLTFEVKPGDQSHDIELTGTP